MTVINAENKQKNKELRQICLQISSLRKEINNVHVI